MLAHRARCLTHDVLILATVMWVTSLIVMVVVYDTGFTLWWERTMYPSRMHEGQFIMITGMSWWTDLTVGLPMLLVLLILAGGLRNPRPNKRGKVWV